MATSELALFPLHAVLFRGSRLPLQVFEPRYIRLIRQSMTDEEAFGVILIQAGSDVRMEPSDEPELAEIGSYARVVDFDALPNGLLGITVVGESRFRLLGRSVEDDGLEIGQVEALVDPPPVPVPSRFEPLTRLLERAATHPLGDAAEPSPIAADASELAARLADLLPIGLAERQELLELDDAVERLDRLFQLVGSMTTSEH